MLSAFRVCKQRILRQRQAVFFFQNIQVEVLESPVVLDGIRHRHTHVLLAVGSSQPYVRWT